MKTLLAFVLFVASAGYAADQTIINENGEHAVAASPTQEQIDEGMSTVDEAAGPAHVWHCTAYPEGHGHSNGYSYSDSHYSHAYNGAVRRCESATHHHCHDVHCHQDH